MNIGRAIRESRERKKLSQRGLAKKINVTASYLCSVERGRRLPGMLLVKKVGDIVGVGMHGLFSAALKFRRGR